MRRPDAQPINADLIRVCVSKAAARLAATVANQVERHDLALAEPDIAPSDTQTENAATDNDQISLRNRLEGAFMFRISPIRF